MRVIVLCEESQTVCRAFREKGHEAYSCDIQDCSGGHPEWHIKGDALEVAYSGGWDLAIAHPPCTKISNAGIGYFNIAKYGDKAIERMIDRLDAAKFFMKLYAAPIKKKCLENPVGFINGWLPPSQVIEPYYFGDADKKRTCLWLVNLPKLVHIKETDLFSESTHVDVQPTYIDKSGKPRYFTDSISGSTKTTSLLRSKTFEGIAKAMAAQWG